MEDVFKLTGKITVENTEANKNIDDVTKKAESASKKMSDSFEKIGSGLKKAGEKITSVGKTMTATLTTGFTALVASGIKYNAQMQDFEANLTTLLGSSDKATKLLKDLKDMAATTPFETTDLISATQTMIGFGISADDAQKYLGYLGDISMGNSEKLKGLSLAFAQVQSTGKLTGQDLLQMINQGFNPLLYISKMTGKSMATLKEEMSDGAISAEMVAEAFAYATQEGQPFYQSMEKSSQTINGRISTLKDNFQMLVGSLTESLLPTFEKIVDKAIQLTEKFQNLSQEQKDQVLKWGAIVAAIGPALIVFGKVTSGLGGLFNAFSKLSQISFISNGINGFVAACGGVAPTLGVVAIAIGAVVSVVIFLKEHWDKVTETFKNFIENTGLAEKFEEIKSKIQPLVEKFKGLKDLFEVIGGAIILILQPAIAYLSGSFNAVVSAISPLIDAIGGLLDILGGLGSFIKSVFTGDLQGAKDAVVQMRDGIVNVFSGLWGAVEGFVSGFKEGVVSYFKSLFDATGVTDFVGKIANKFGEMKDKSVTKVGELKDNATQKFEELKSKANDKINSMKENVSSKVSDMKSKVVSRFQEMNTSSGGHLGNMVTTISSKFSSITSTIGSKMSAAKNKVNEMLNGMKSAFSNFTAKIKLPHFKISGKLSLNPPSIPKLSVDWYAKAMNNPMILNEPTVFGMSPTGKIRAGGEAGSEVVSGTNTLMKMISNSVATQNESLLDRLEAIVRLLVNWLPQLANMQLVTDTGVLIGEIAPGLDDELGRLKERKERGR